MNSQINEILLKLLLPGGHMKNVDFLFLCLLATLAFLRTDLAQIRWEDYRWNPILRTGSGWDFHWIDVGSVIQESDSSYIMWYSGSADALTASTGRATSKDGLVWLKDPSNPVLQLGSSSDWDAGGAFDPNILSTDSGYVMFYFGVKNLNSSPLHGEIGRATSIDGKFWVKDSLNPILTYGQSPDWDSDYVTAPTVMFDGSTYKMWYNGATSDFPSATSCIGLATSSDGIHWAKYGQNPVLKSGSSISWDNNGVGLCEVIYDLGYYRMWYEGDIINFHNGLMGGLGYAVSEDGINWKKYPGNPVIPSNFISWTLGTPYDPAVIRNGNVLRMWYSAGNSVGYATSILSPPLITFPDSLSFTGRGVNDTLSISIGNWGYIPLKPLIIDSLFHINTNFKILNPPSLFTAIQPFDDIKIQILFQPKQAGSYTDTLYISSNDTSQLIKKIVLTGQSTATDVEKNSSALPLRFDLSQNFPNPFNPTTVINYSVPKAGFVNITVYDLLGREVKTLVSEEKAAGNYTVQFSGSSLASGIYFYRMQAGDFMQSKKMILLK
jgi:predicted GH43/DUF377 family glycosyl hydrolase